MKINPIFKVRKVAGENIILLQGKTNGDMTRVVAFNESALLMWDSLQGKDFTVESEPHHAVSVPDDGVVVGQKGAS